MENKIKMEINGITYVPESEARQVSEDLDGMPYKIFRTYSSGVFGGYLAKKEDSVGHYKCVVKKARRFHKWSGAASLSQLAEEGVNNPDTCRFAMELTGDLELPNVVEIISVTDTAKKNIDEVPIWRV